MFFTDVRSKELLPCVFKKDDMLVRYPNFS
jgi:hypothetical protein